MNIFKIKELLFSGNEENIIVALKIIIHEGGIKKLIEIINSREPLKIAYERNVASIYRWVQVSVVVVTWQVHPTLYAYVDNHLFYYTGISMAVWKENRTNVNYGNPIEGLGKDITNLVKNDNYTKSDRTTKS